MARKPTDKQLFKMKNEWLGQFYEEVKPKDFYRAVFPEGSFEREGVRCKRLWRKKKESRRAAQAALIGKIGIVPLPETV